MEFWNLTGINGWAIRVPCSCSVHNRHGWAALTTSRPTVHTRRSGRINAPLMFRRNGLNSNLTISRCLPDESHVLCSARAKPVFQIVGGSSLLTRSLGGGEKEPKKTDYSRIFPYRRVSPSRGWGEELWNLIATFHYSIVISVILKYILK